MFVTCGQAFDYMDQKSQVWVLLNSQGKHFLELKDLPSSLSYHTYHSQLLEAPPTNWLPSDSETI